MSTKNKIKKGFSLQSIKHHLRLPRLAGRLRPATPGYFPKEGGSAATAGARLHPRKPRDWLARPEKVSPGRGVAAAAEVFFLPPKAAGLVKSVFIALYQGASRSLVYIPPGAKFPPKASSRGER